MLKTYNQQTGYETYRGGDKKNVWEANFPLIFIFAISI